MPPLLSRETGKTNQNTNMEILLWTPNMQKTWNVAFFLGDKTKPTENQNKVGNRSHSPNWRVWESCWAPLGQPLRLLLLQSAWSWDRATHRVQTTQPQRQGPNETTMRMGPWQQALHSPNSYAQWLGNHQPISTREPQPLLLDCSLEKAAPPPTRGTGSDDLGFKPKTPNRPSEI